MTPPDGAATIARSLGGEYRSGSWWRARCPAHNSTGPTLALRDTPQGPAFYCHAGCSSAAVRAALKRCGLLVAGEGAVHHDPEAEQRHRQQRTAAAAFLWEETAPANWIVETYLGGRLILGPIPPTIRLHRNLRHRETGGSRPAMVGKVEHAEHGFVAVHCTYLVPNGEGKASVVPVKRFIGPVGGGAVRLAPAAETLAVSEGIESGLSYQEATGIPTWAALSALGVRKLVLPDQVRHVVIAADPDPVGIMAARAAARRWLAEGRRVSLARPPLGLDFNDMARVVLG